jgi:hypothetical protein
LPFLFQGLGCQEQPGVVGLLDLLWVLSDAGCTGVASGKEANRKLVPGQNIILPPLAPNIFEIWAKKVKKIEIFRYPLAH